MEFAGLEDAQLNQVRRDRAVRMLYASRQIAVGEFHCEPDDPRWWEENCADEGYFVAFPGTTVVIAQTGRAPAVASRNEVVLYNQGQSYRRGLVDPSGDHCVFLMLAPSLLAEVSAAVGSHADEERVAFSSHVAPVAAGTFLLQRLIVGTLRGADAWDALRIEEALYRLLFEVARAGFPAVHAQGRRRQTLRAHALIVEQTKSLLAKRFAERLVLAEVAREMHVSPFHLGRIFRARTGFGIHEYRDQLRLRVALDRIFEFDVTLSKLALDLGYASHSHFTDSFRRVFGIPPSAVRPSGRALSELHEKLVRLP
jgi:AraC family transcriptional regulator